MNIQVLLFGRLREIAGVDHCDLNEVRDTDEVIIRLNSKYPGLADMKYLVAVEKEIIRENTVLGENNTVALMPPYSGG